MFGVPAADSAADVVDLVCAHADKIMAAASGAGSMTTG
jgi:hypothetical protein